MEVNRIKQLQRLRTSIPDMQKTLDTVKFLESKQASVMDDLSYNRALRKILKRDSSLMIHYTQLRPFLLPILSIYGLE